MSAARRRQRDAQSHQSENLPVTMHLRTPKPVDCQQIRLVQIAFGPHRQMTANRCICYRRRNRLISPCRR